ncbi:M10 family metallopeptidase C-terminal domain-containing protein [Tropicimonas sediminicola]|uniref:Hemolysin-type calcium-binding repeat-containing protein n=1 Tax=Tropicimonas sediminicola TaxID=1031541 RepID=A0A239M2V3_9RHOB|nr:M10 family metallopeptidase C-terminal domain-containing protein [Tropicimonas sediminicola]SNT36920.1 Hemolysin-type calcium-binding repeat-containing protein [Tropicimonas sediminicola]
MTFQSEILFNSIVNIEMADAQWYSDVAAISDSLYFVTWMSKHDDAVYGRVVGTDGSMGPEILLDSEGYKPEVVALESGRILLGWQENNGTPNYYGYKVFEHTAAKGLVEVADNRFQKPASGGLNEHELLALANGGFAVVNADWGEGGSLRIYIGNPIDYGVNEVHFSPTVNASIHNNENVQDLAQLSNGNIVIGWAESSIEGIFYRAVVLNESGKEVISPFELDGTLPGALYGFCEIVPLPGGGFAFFADYRNPESDAITTYMRLYDADGNHNETVGTVDTVVGIPWAAEYVDGIGIVLISDGVGTVLREDGSILLEEFPLSGLEIGGGTRPSVADLGGGKISLSFEYARSDVTGWDRIEVGTSVIQISDVDLRPTSSQVFDEFGYVPFMSWLAQGAYKLASNEPKDPTYNNTDGQAEAKASLDKVKLNLTPLTGSDLPALKNSSFDDTPGDVWSDGIRSGGIFTNDNAAAFVARSKDGVFISFRGTNDSIELDHVGWGSNSSYYDHYHWANRGGHFNLFVPLLEEIRDYIVAARAIGDDIGRIYLTGHSLGGAMVQAAYKWLRSEASLSGIGIEGVTFATPGYSILPGGDDPNHSIVNFWNSTDIINLPANVSQVLGGQYKFNNALRELVGGIDPLEAHNMELYRTSAEFLHNEISDAWSDLRSVGLSGKRPAVEKVLYGLNIDRIAFSVKEVNGSFTVGEKNDYVMAGAYEMVASAVKGAAPSYVLKSHETAKGLWDGYSATVDAAKFMTTPVETMTYGESKTALDVSLEVAYEGLSLAANFSPKLKIAKALLDAWIEYSKSDFVVGGPGNDTVYGLGGGDVILGGAGEDVIGGGQGKDFIFGGRQKDIISGGWGQDVIYGNQGNDRLVGGRDNDTIHGGIGDDWIDGEGGEDNLFGETGDDVFVVDDKNDLVHERSGEGRDTVVNWIDYTLPDHVENLVLGERSLFGSIFGNLDGTGNELGNLLVGNAEGNVLKGLGGKDKIDGRGGADTLRGGGERDFLFGKGGKDNLFGGEGLDVLDGGAKYDELTGGADKDRFVFSSVSEIDGDRIKDFEVGLDLIDLRPLAKSLGLTFLFLGTSSFTSSNSEIRIDKGNKTTKIKIDLDPDRWADETIVLDGSLDVSVNDFLL